ncbi:hypothetical protein LINGRAHAP2_LOCUS30463, partial [Linum grandiflorum]
MTPGRATRNNPEMSDEHEVSHRQRMASTSRVMRPRTTIDLTALRVLEVPDAVNRRYFNFESPRNQDRWLVFQWTTMQKSGIIDWADLREKGW